MKEKILDLNDSICKNWCNETGRTKSYTLAFVYAAIIDIVIPIMLFFVGLPLLAVGFGMEGLFPDSIIISGYIGLIILIATFIGIVVLWIFLVKEIGIFGIFPIAMAIIVILIGLVPGIFFVARVLSFVPWHIVAVLLHWLLYIKLK